MPVVTMKELLEAGVHFGHKPQRWNPKMRSYIFTERNDIHIIDLQQTIARLEDAYALVRDVAAEGGLVLFVGTKRQAQQNLQIEAERCGMPYVNQRWLGGTLTNFRTIRQRIEYFIELETQKEDGELDRLTKKEALRKDRELTKLTRRFGGLRDLMRLPDAVFITDVRRETIAVKEAITLGIPIVAMVDTNCDPDGIEYIIPANDDAIRGIKLIATKIANGVVEGQAMRGVIMDEEEPEPEFDDFAGTPFEAEEELPVVEDSPPTFDLEESPLPASEMDIAEPEAPPAPPLPGPDAVSESPLEPGTEETPVSDDAAPAPADAFPHLELDTEQDEEDA